jgi:hypothetical protein
VLFRVQRSAQKLNLFNPWWSDIPEEIVARQRDALYLPEYLTSEASARGRFAREQYEELRAAEDMRARLRLEMALDSSAHEFASFLDRTIADIISAQRDLVRVANYLNRRIVGSWWIRVLSVVQK